MDRTVFNYPKYHPSQAMLSGLMLAKRFFFILAAIMCPAVWAEARCDQQAAILESVEGKVEWTSAESQWQTAVRGDVFCYGDQIRVLEQRAALRLANNTLVRLQENSVVTLLQEDKGFWIGLLRGAGHFLSRTPKQLTVKAAYLNAAIDGTEFVVTADGERNRVVVFEGDVRVFNDYGEVRLGEGTATSATAASAPNSAHAIRLRDAADWILYYPPLIIQSSAVAEVAHLMEQERYGDALEHLSQQDMTAENALLAASLALVSGRPAEADRLLDLTLQQQPQSADALALRALKALNDGDAQSAHTQTTALLQTNTDNISVLLAHAYTLQSQGKIEEALQINRRALTLAPDNLFILARTAELELSADNPRAARTLIDHALKKTPHHSRLNTLAGFIALNRFANKEAQNYFHTAIANNDSDPLARLGLALALVQKGKITEGRAQMEMAVLLDPSSSLLRSYLGKTYVAQGEHDWAHTQYQLAKRMDLNDPTPWFYQAHLKHRENKSGEALQLITTAIEKNDNRAVYRSQLLLDSDATARSANLAGIYKALGFTETAINTAALSVFNNPGDFAGHQALVTAYSDEPKAQILRAKEVLKTRLLSPIGAKELPVGAGEVGLQVYPWASPGKPGAQEHAYLFAQRGLSGAISGTFGSQSSTGYEWLLQATGQNLSVSAGQYDYQTDGYRNNNDLDIRINEANIHYQASDRTKLFVQLLTSDESTGDLANHPESPLFKDTQRKEKSSDRHLIGLSHRISSDSLAIFTASEIKSDHRNTEFPPLRSVISELASKSRQFEAVYLGKINAYAFQVGGYVQNYDLAGEHIIRVIIPGQPAIEQITPEWERAEYRTLYTSVSSPANSTFRGTASIGYTDINVKFPELDYSSNNLDYKLGALLFPESPIKLNIAHWRLTASRLPSHPSWGMTEPFYINTTEDLTNFAEQVSTAVKLYIVQNQGNTVSINFQDSRVSENAQINRGTEKALGENKTQTQSFGINIEHQISPRVTLAASSAIYDSELKPAVISNRVVSVTNYINAAKFKFHFWKNASFLTEIIHLQQRKLTQDPADPQPIGSSDQGLIANIAAELSWRNPTFKMHAGIYNLFNLNENFHHANLTQQSESIAPSQLIWPAERSAVLNVTYSF